MSMRNYIREDDDNRHYIRMSRYYLGEDGDRDLERMADRELDRSDERFKILVAGFGAIMVLLFTAWVLS